jgi:TetR/AcrR family transcriptional regulator, regulator of mycofactocin system
MMTLTTQRRLQEAALDLFERVGFDAVTVEDISQAAGTSRRTFFRYFATKEDAAVADFDARIELLGQLLSAERQPGHSAIDHVIEAGRVVFSQFLAEPDFYLKRYRIVLANTALVDRMTAADQRYEEMIALAVFNDFPGEMGGLHARMFAASALAVTNAVVERWIARPSSDPEPFAAAAVTELRRAAWVWQGQSTRSSQVIVLSDSDLSPAEIRRRLTSDASLDPDRAQAKVSSSPSIGGDL